MERRIRTALEAVHQNNPDGHHLGAPYVSAYQIAIALDAEDPALVGAIGKEVGGQGTGEHHSLAQYIAQQLANGIRNARNAGRPYFVEGAFVSNERVQSITYRGNDGGDIRSSLAGSNFDMAIFRLARDG